MKRGEYYERRAGEYLRAAGLAVVERNFRCKLGEIDLICREGDTVVFVEVRFRGNPRFASAAASVTPAKQRRLIAAARFYLQQRGLTERQPCRFDVLAFDGAACNAEDGIEWLKNAIGA